MHKIDEKPILFCTVPDGPLRSSTTPLENDDGFNPSLGILRLIDWMGKNEYENCYNFYDINSLRPTEKKLRHYFKQFNPKIVGLSASLVHCYPSYKRITQILRELFPDIWIIVGGHMTASANVILGKTATDICVVGDGEIAWVKLLNYFKLAETNKQWDYSTLGDIKGLAFLDDDNSMKLTGYGEQISESEMEFPDYEILKAGLQDKPEWVEYFFGPIKGNKVIRDFKGYDPNSTGKVAIIPTSKGCVARCTFCQRYTKGYRVYSLEKLESYVMHLKEKYNVEYIYISDENFGSNKAQAYDFARIMKKCNMYWMILGVRCKGTTYQDLKFYKEHNLIFMKFGIESGSEKILAMMEKKFDVKDILDGVSNCAKLGILNNPDALMLGMPGETDETVIESANFIARLRYILGKDNQIGAPFWAMAVPGTPLYEYCQQIGVIGKTIDEEEEYLLLTSEGRTNLLNYINKTNSELIDVFFWDRLFNLEGKRAYMELLRSSDTNLINKFKLIYQRCIQTEFQILIELLKARKFKLGHIDNLVTVAFNLCNLFLPRGIVYPIAKQWSNLRFIQLKWKNTKHGKHHLFNQQNSPIAERLINEKKLSQAKRLKEKSLRTIVAENRGKMAIGSLSEQEKNYKLLSMGR